MLFSRILAPYFQKMMGIGTSSTATQPSKVPAQLTPSARNVYCEKRGKPAPARERRKVLAAMAEAALGLVRFWFRGFFGGGYLQHEVGVYDVV